MIGKAFGYCEITGRFGKGGMGEGYRANDQALDPNDVSPAAGALV